MVMALRRSGKRSGDGMPLRMVGSNPFYASTVDYLTKFDNTQDQSVGEFTGTTSRSNR